MRRVQTFTAWTVAILLVALAVDVVVEALVMRSVAFHTGSGAMRVRHEFAGYPWSEQVEASHITRLAGSEKWPGRWRTYSTSHGLFLNRGVACSMYGEVPEHLGNAALLLEQYQPDAARRRAIAQQLLRFAHADNRVAIENWERHASEAIDAGLPLPEP